MKKLSLLVLALLAVGAANAQRMGLNVGYAPQTLVASPNDGDDRAEFHGGFAGLNYNATLSGNINLSIGAQARFNFKSEERGTESAKFTVKYQQWLVDVPLLLNYTLKAGRDFVIAPFFGPTFSYGISGKKKYEGDILETEVSRDGEDWYDGDNSPMNRLDVSLTVGLSLNFTDFRFYGGYNMGLLDLDKSDDISVKARTWFVGLGYML